MSLGHLEKYALTNAIRAVKGVSWKPSTRELERLSGRFKLKPKAPKKTMPLPPPRAKTMGDALEPQSYANLTQRTPDLESQLAAIQRFLKG